MKAKRLNLVEQIGLEQLLRQYNILDNPENFTLGTSENNLRNLDNVYIDFWADSQYCFLGGVGMLEAEYIVIEMWNEEATDRKHYYCSHYQIDEPENWTEFELEKVLNHAE